MALAAATHHSAQQNAAPRGPKTGARARVGVEHEQHDGLRAQKPPLPGERPGCLVDPVPQRSDRTVRRSAGDSLPTPGLPVLAGASGEAVDAFTLSFLTAKALEDKRKEEVARKEAQKEAKRRKKQDAVDAAMVEFRTLLVLPKERETPETQRRLDELHQLLYSPSSSSGARRKKKKRRKKKTPKSSSFRSSSGVRPRRCGPGSRFRSSSSGGLDVPVLFNDKFQQSKLYMFLKAPQLQFIDRVVDILVMRAETCTHSANCAAVLVLCLCLTSVMSASVRHLTLTRTHHLRVVSANRA